MKKRSLILLVGAVAHPAAAGFVTRSSWMGGSSNAQGPQRPRMVSVELAKAERKSVPVDVDAIGMVTPISSVALKSRLETTIVAVHFEDGAKVNEGDLLFTLDSRQIDAQIEQAEGVLAKDQAQLEGAQRDLRRYNDLVGKGATTQVNVDNAKTQSDILTGTIKADQAALDNLKVQKSYTTIRAPFSGRIGAANVKVGNFVRPADTRAACRHQPDGAGLCDRSRFRSACWSTCASRWRRAPPAVTATIPGHQRSETGKVAMVENTVDATTGMVTVRGIMNNENETLVAGNPGRDQARSSAARMRSWCRRSPCSAARAAISCSSSRTASPRFSRSRSTAPSQGMSVISEGLAGGESVVVDGQLLLSDGTRVEPRTKKAGA